MAPSVLNSQGLSLGLLLKIKQVYITERQRDREMGRSPCCAKEGLNRGAWTATEDRILTEYIKVHGEGKWRNLPKKAGLKRCGKSCRLRWLNYLRPDIKRGNITDDEEELIIRLHNLLGNRWSLIAGRLPGRTDNEIKNYWNTNIVKKIMQGRPALSAPIHKKTMIQSDDEKLNSMTDSPPPVRVHYAKPSRCTRVFLPTEPNDDHDQVIDSTRSSVLLGEPSSPMVQEVLAKVPDNSPPLISSSDHLIPEFKMDANFISDLLNSDVPQLCDFNIGVSEADNNNSSDPQQTPFLINEEILQNANLFSMDSFLDSEMDWFC